MARQMRENAHVRRVGARGGTGQHMGVRGRVAGEPETSDGM